MKSLRGRNFLTLQEFSPKEISYLLDKTEEMKKAREKGKPHKLLDGKTLLMLFQKPSTRTRVSFETGMFELGGQAIFFHEERSQVKRGESLKDTSLVLSRYVHGIMARVFEQNYLEELAEWSSVPVISGLSNFLHPCQVLSDLFTIRETMGKLKGAELFYIGAANNVSNSLMVACTKMGVNITVVSPEWFPVDKRIMDWVEKNSAESGSSFKVETSIPKDLSNADVIYTDAWESMHQNFGKEEIDKIMKPYQVNMKLLETRKKMVKIMHDLPAHRGEEITSNVMDSEFSIIFRQAENRLHAQKALLSELL